MSPVRRVHNHGSDRSSFPQILHCLRADHGGMGTTSSAGATGWAGRMSKRRSQETVAFSRFLSVFSTDRAKNAACVPRNVPRRCAQNE